MLNYKVFINGRFAFVQAFPDTMTKAEIEAELAQNEAKPVRVALVRD